MIQSHYGSFSLFVALNRRIRNKTRKTKKRRTIKFPARKNNAAAC
ncbi:hypothetical protein HMPREF1580_01237 [Gardnerella vaginalis JCP8070]|nr:hypothetical protein HMPREF1580_01237 [Gardnerella vaginalis JCP8070]